MSLLCLPCHRQSLTETSTRSSNTANRLLAQWRTKYRVLLLLPNTRCIAAGYRPASRIDETQEAMSGGVNAPIDSSLVQKRPFAAKLALQL